MLTKHFLVYHNPDRMPYDVTQMSTCDAFSNRVNPSVRNARIWVLGGVGAPRLYYLGGTFLCDSFTIPGQFGFEFGMSGKDGCLFASTAHIGNEMWFPEVQRVTGNFEFGLTEVEDTSIISGLVNAASRCGCIVFP